MPLRETSDVDVKTSILRHRGLIHVTTNVVLANVRGGIAVFAKCLSHRDCFRRDILTLLWASEFSFLFTDSATTITIQIPHNVDVVMNSRRVLTGQHRRSRRRAIRLSISMSET